MAKSRDAFRTISEVSEALDTPAHVLRFWESKFRQIKPVKRAGGRRYYRPDDLALLASIKDMLHNQGHSIKNAQKLIREAGIKTIVAQGHSILGSSDTSDAIDAPAMPPPTAAPHSDTQPDLFGEDEVAATAPEPVSAAAEPTPEPATPQAAPAPIATAPLPDLPEERANSAPRLLATLMAADPDQITKNRVQIAALADRLSALRDEMRHPW